MRQVIPGTYQFVNEPEKLTNLTSATNILFDDSAVTINYTTSPLSGISTDKFVLAVDMSNESQRYTLYAFEDTTAAGGALNVSKGWYWFDASSMSLSAISAPVVTFTSSCTLNDNMSTDQGNSLFTTAPIQEEIIEYERVLYKGKEEYSMEEFEALTTLDDAVDYNILDYPGNSITNAQMTFALTCKRLFPQDCSFVCSDDGAYIKGHVYKINVNGEVKTWEDITTNTLTNASLEGHTHINEYTLGNGDLYEARFQNGYIYDRENRLNFPSKSGTFALLDDISGGSTGGQTIQYTDVPVAENNISGKVIQYIGKTFDNSVTSYITFINVGQLSALTTYAGNIEVNWSIGGTSTASTLTKLDSEQAWSYESDLISFILMPTSDAFSQPAMSTELSGYYTLQCVLSEQLNSEILSKNTFFINTIATLVPSRDVIFNTGSLGYSNFDLMMATNAGYSLPQLFISTYYNNTLTVDSLKTYVYVNMNEFKYRLITQNDSSSGLTPGYYSCGNTSKYIQFIDSSTCETPAGLPGYDDYTSWTYVLDDTNKKVILNHPAGDTKVTLYLDDEYKSIRMSGSNYEEIFIFTAAYITGHFYRCSLLNYNGAEIGAQWEPTDTQSKPIFTLIGTTLVIQD